MKTYTVKLTGERALPLLESERDELATRVAILDAQIAEIRRESGIEENTTPARTRRRTLPSVVASGLDFLNGALDGAIENGIKKTESGRSAKGHTEASIIKYLQQPNYDVRATLAISNDLKANYSTVYRSLKKMEEQGLVTFDGTFWRRTQKLRESA